jgi:DDE superfamily endonuclease/Helix-turn-helix of DDE superfamily endonuclease
MNLILNTLEKKPKEAKRLLGINYKQFIKLVDLAQQLHKERIELSETQKVRINRAGGGNKAKLSIQEQVLLTLIYLRHNPTFQMLGIQFEISESAAHYIFHYWQSILEKALPPSLLEQVKKYPSEEEWIKEIIASLELVVDSWESNRERPKDYQEQKSCYSGKKKNHTYKNQAIILPQGKDIVDVVLEELGTKSDISIWRKKRHQFSETQKFRGDKAYIGEKQIKYPHKKPKNGELTEQQKAENKESAKTRIYVEHLIRVIKIFRVGQERFRLRTRKYSSIMNTICGLVRLRIGAIIF